ncbi:MAG: hypothetical protein PHH54_03440 [Candidatus Nanoarchaeia archaeon]|nr:hypothetical protein [Candidatus Nanoarchaeia archaeon]MDD5741011.1 hypothetical protein [Candidatus Nanoarchaeia archaeon]
MNKLLTKEKTAELIDQLHRVKDLIVSFEGAKQFYKVKDEGYENMKRLTRIVAENFHKKLSKLTDLTVISQGQGGTEFFTDLCNIKGNPHIFEAWYARPVSAGQQGFYVPETFEVPYELIYPHMKGEDILSFNIKNIRVLYQDQPLKKPLEIIAGQSYTKQQLKTLAEFGGVSSEEVRRLEPSKQYFFVGPNDNIPDSINKILNNLPLVSNVLGLKK